MEGYKFRVCGNGGQHYYSIINDKYLTRFSVPLHPKPQRQEFFAVADDIEERRDVLIEFQEKHLHRASRNHTLLTICKSLS